MAHQTREHEFPPLLFNLTPTAVHPQSELKTPGAAFPIARASTPRGNESSLSTARRSVTTPGSAHTEATPSRPPPLMRLAEAAPEEAAPPPTTTLAAAAAPRLFQMAQTPEMLPVTPAVHTEDVWVTVFGFSQVSLPLVLEEFQKCGEIVVWGTFGSPPTANFIHIKFTDKYSAQRALLKDHEQLAPGLIVGVKTLSAQHKQDVAQHAVGSPALQVRQLNVPVRSYTISASAKDQLPRPGKGLLAKFQEFVIGI